MYKGTEQKHLVNIPLNVLRSRIEIAFVNFNLLNFSRSLLYIQHVSTKCENTDQREIPDIISTNIFLCKKFSLQFYQRVINKKQSGNGVAKAATVVLGMCIAKYTRTSNTRRRRFIEYNEYFFIKRKKLYIESYSSTMDTNEIFCFYYNYSFNIFLNYVLYCI